ncbi:fructoselysine 6-kinase, partial [Enterococcus faecium]
MGGFGSDEEAAHVLSAIKEKGLDNSHSRFEKGENGCARVKIEEGDRIFLGSNSGGVTREYAIQLTEEDREYLNQFELIHMGLYS